MIKRNIIIFILTISGCLTISYAAILATKSNDNIIYPNQITNTSNPKDDSSNKPKRSSNAIQIALLLDTSGSMEGLIEQAKSQLWNILGELSRTQKGEEEPTLEIALYEYGNPSKADRKNQIHQLSNFTTDMDLISEKLFSLSTSGGDEYCGAVIKASLDDLDWTNNDGLKMIYIAGNEPFNQGPISYSKSCRTAKSKGIVINTIYCDKTNDRTAHLWNTAAKTGGGEFFSINHNEETTYINTPFDDEIAELNIKLNDTYIAYNEKGRKKKDNQVLQDSNAGSYSQSNLSERANFKASKKYKADDWDLIDSYKKDKSIIGNAKINNSGFENLTPAQLESKIEEISAEREDVKIKIKELNKKRVEYKSKVNTSKKDNLQNSIIKTVRKQAKAKGYKFEQ